MGGHQALGEVNMQPRRVPKELKDAANRVQFWLVWMAKDDHVVCIKRDKGYHLPAR
jgi:hypothetical protein